MKRIICKIVTISFIAVSFVFQSDTYANTKSWENTLTEMTTARRNLSSIAYNNKIFVLGGIEGRADSKKVEAYNIETDTWESLPDMPVERYSHESVLYKDKIYIIGGYNKAEGFLNRVDIYNLKTGEWSQGANMPTPRSSFVAEVVNGVIYCIGGEVASGYTDALEMYDIESNSWTKSRNLSVARGDTDGVYKDGKIYIVGGYDGVNALDTVDVYDVQKGTWDTLSSLNIARYSSSVTVYRDEIYALGGYNSSHLAISSVEKYNITTNTWEQMSDMTDVKGGATAQSYYGKIYLIGGHNDVNDVSSVLSYTAKSTDTDGKAVDSVEKAEDSLSDGDIIIGRRFVENVTVDKLKEDLTMRLNFLEGIFERKSVSANVDIYIKSENMISLSLDTNNIKFDDYSGVEDMEKPGAVKLTVSSSLPYKINAYLSNEMQNADKSETLDKSILNIKESSESVYKQFTNTTDAIVLLDNQIAGNDKIHSLDFKLATNLAHKADVYKTTIKFEVEQK